MNILRSMGKNLPERGGICGVIALALLGCGTPLLAREAALAVDFDRVAKEDVNPGAAGINLCWLLDSDRRRRQPAPMVRALAELGVGVLRFPYGHLADNYLWDSPPYDRPGGGLRPKVASLNLPPGQWTWATKPDGSMPGGMDFDEYIELCGKIGARSLVCVNALSFKYPGGPTYGELKAAAVAWVRYAVTHRLRVDYWQIGNEVDHGDSAKLLPMEAYVALYEDFARAMKAVDPAARIGPGILARPAYYRAVAQACPALVDFASVHQYMWGSEKKCHDYAGWRDCPDSFVKNIEQAAKTLEAGGLTQTKLLVTETGVSGGSALGEVNNTYKALWCFEVLMNELAHPRVAYSFYWGTHTPWSYRGDEVEPAKDVALALRLRTNARTPTGEVIRLINRHLLGEFVDTERVVGRLRGYALRTPNRRERVLLLLNKDDQAAPVAITLAGASPGEPTERVQFGGRAPDDVAPVVSTPARPVVTGQVLRTALAPLSVTIFRWTDEK